MPADFLDGEKIVKGLTGCLTLLRDDGFTDQEMLEWLFTPMTASPAHPPKLCGRIAGPR